MFNKAESTAERSGSGNRQALQQQFKDATRRAILDAALELFVADGYARVSLRNIAAKVGYSPAALYSYFTSKDEIFFALADEGLRHFGRQELAAQQLPDPLEELRASFWRLYLFSTEQPQYFALVFLDRHVPRISREYETFAFMTELRHQMFARIERCIEAGVFPAGLDTIVAARLLFSAVIGVAALQLSNRLAPNENPDTLARHAIEVTLAGLRVAGPVAAADAAKHSPDSCT